MEDHMYVVSARWLAHISRNVSAEVRAKRVRIAATEGAVKQRREPRVLRVRSIKLRA